MYPIQLSHILTTVQTDRKTYFHSEGLLQLEDILLSLFHFEPQALYIAELRFHQLRTNHHWNLRLNKEKQAHGT